MREGKNASIVDCFGALEDPRIDRCKRRQLPDIIAIAICAVICGADSWVYVEMFGKRREALPGAGFLTHWRATSRAEVLNHSITHLAAPACN